MLHCFFCSVFLYCAVLCSTQLSYAVLYCGLFSYLMLCGIEFCSVILCSVVLCFVSYIMLFHFLLCFALISYGFGLFWDCPGVPRGTG